MHACMPTNVLWFNDVTQNAYQQEYYLHIKNQDPSSFSLRDAYMHACMHAKKLKSILWHTPYVAQYYVKKSELYLLWFGLDAMQ